MSKQYGTHGTRGGIRGAAVVVMLAVLLCCGGGLRVSAVSSALPAAGGAQRRDCVDDMVFFGESTTAHLRSRGVLRGGKGTTQVWSDASNTMLLSPDILHKRLIDPATGEQRTIEQLAARYRPRCLVLSFGFNGLSSFCEREQVYLSCYAKLIRAVREASPETGVILQTVYPVAPWYADAADVNAKVQRLNALLPSLAESCGALVADTASVLRDGQGMLCAAYAMEDGLHLRAEAYEQVLQYLRANVCL